MVWGLSWHLLDKIKKERKKEKVVKPYLCVIGQFLVQDYNRKDQHLLLHLYAFPLLFTPLKRNSPSHQILSINFRYFSHNSACFLHVKYCGIVICYINIIISLDKWCGGNIVFLLITLFDSKWCFDSLEESS